MFGKVKYVASQLMKTPDIRKVVKCKQTLFQEFEMLKSMWFIKKLYSYKYDIKGHIVYQ